MQTLLDNLNTVPGVIGSLVCDADGQPLAKAFPPAFDGSGLAETAKAAAEGATGLGKITGTVRMLDLRYANARVVVRPVAGAHLLFVCAPSMNLQPLVIAASVAARRLEKLIAERSVLGSGASAGGAARAAPGGQLHAMVQKINAIIERKRLDPFKARGEIAIRAGFGLAFIDAETPDDPEKLLKLTASATAVLGEPL